LGVGFLWVVYSDHASIYNTVMEIWPFEVLPGRLFKEQRSIVGRLVGRSSILHWSYILLFALVLIY